MFFKHKSEPLERKCILEVSDSPMFQVNGLYFFENVEENVVSTVLGNASLDQYISPLISAISQFVNPSQQQPTPHQFTFHQPTFIYNSSGASNAPPAMDPQKEQQIISEALNTIKNFVSTWTLRSLRKYYVVEQQSADRLLRELRKCFESAKSLEQQIVILYITHKFAVATCAPQLVMEVLTYGTSILNEKIALPLTPILSELLPTNITRAKIQKRNLGSLVNNIIGITIETCEKNTCFKFPDNLKGKLLVFEEMPFLITKDIRRLFEAMRRYMMSRNSSLVKEKVSRAALKYLNNTLERNLLNMDLTKLSEANGQLVEYIAYTGVPEDLLDVLTIHLIIIKEGEAASISHLKNLFPEKLEKDDEIKRSVSSALQYFERIMYFYKRVDSLPSNHKVDCSFLKHHNISRFNFMKDFFILTTELVQNLFQKNPALASKIINDVSYVRCVDLIVNAVDTYRKQHVNSIDPDFWVEMENSARTNQEKLSPIISIDLVTRMQYLHLYIGLGLLNSSIQFSDDWKSRSIILHLGKIRKSLQEDNTSELFEKMSISECSDSKDSFCSSSHEDPSTMFSRIFPDELRTIEQIDDIYLEMFQHNYYKMEKYPWLENLSIDQNKRQIILFTLCSVLKAVSLHCGTNLTLDTIRTIHTEVENAISAKRYTNDYNSVHIKELKTILKDVLTHTDQLAQVNTLNGYYKTIEEGHGQEYFVPEKDVFDAIFHKKNHFTEMFRLNSLANSFSRHLDILLDENIDVSFSLGGFFDVEHKEDSLVYNLGSCGIDTFQHIMFKLFSLHARLEASKSNVDSLTNKITQILNRMDNMHYRNIIIKCALEIVVRMYFDNFNGESPVPIKKGLITNLEDGAFARILDFYVAILKSSLFKDSIMSAALASHAITYFKNYFMGSCNITYDSRMMIVLAPYLFSSRVCAEILSTQPDILALIFHTKERHELDQFLFFMFKSSILKLAFDHTIINQDLMVNNFPTECQEFFLEIVRQGLGVEIVRKDFQQIYEEAFAIFGAIFRRKGSSPNWGNLKRITDEMYLYFARYWTLQRQPVILSNKQLRQATLSMEEVNVLRSDYYPKEALYSSLGSMVQELTSDLLSKESLSLKPTLWLIGIVETLAENPGHENSKLFFDLFQACIDRLANNNTFVEVLISLCRFLIKRSNTWESYLSNNVATLNNSDLKKNLEIMMKNIDNSLFKNTSITLHKYCIDLFQMVYITANNNFSSISIPDMCNFEYPKLVSSLFNEQGETPFFKHFNFLVHSLRTNHSSISQTFSNVCKLDTKVALAGFGTSSRPICKYIQLLLQSDMASQIIRNSNFSLFYSSNSNSKLLLLPFIKNAIPTQTKKKALLAELNIFTCSKQDIVPSAYLFLSKQNVTKTSKPLNFETFQKDPINHFKQHIGNMKYGSANDYAYLLPVENMGYDSGLTGIANIVVLNMVCERVQTVLPTLSNPSEIATCYFVIGCLLGSSLLCRCYLGPLSIDHEVLQAFVDSTNIPQGSPKYEMANNFVTGLRSVLGDDLANFLKIFTVGELVSLTCDGNVIVNLVNAFLNDHVDRDAECEQTSVNQFLSLLGSAVSEDIHLATLLLNYLDAINAGMENSYSLNIIPSRFNQVQINRSARTVDLSICQTKEELKHNLTYAVRLHNQHDANSYGL